MIEVDLKLFQIALVLLCFYYTNSIQEAETTLSPGNNINNVNKSNKGGYLTWRKQNKNSYRLICYMTNWAQYRPNNTKYVPTNLDPFLCTHVIYAFAAINTTTFEIRSFEWNDESKKGFIGRYEEFNNLKKINPKLKTLLAVGGWNMGSKPFSDMSRNETNRQIFIRSAVKFLRKWKFDGLDLDWEFPAKREGSSPEDKQYFTYLVRDLREAFYNEAMSKRKEQLLLSAAVAAEKLTILRAYEVEAIVPHLDFISIMSYDYHGSWDKKLGHNSPLYAAVNGNDEDKKLTVDYTVRLYLTLGVPLEKLVVGIPYYGRSFTMKNKNMKNYGAECTGEGLAGEASREAGFLAYGFEICKYVKSDNWTRVWSREHQAPYAYKNLQWVGYDDEESIKVKIEYINKHCLGGAMIWSIDLDDFTGVCGDQPYPLTRFISNSLQTLDRKKCMPLAKVTSDSDIEAYMSKVYKWVPSSNELVEESIEKLRTFNINSTFQRTAQQQQQFYNNQQPKQQTVTTSRPTTTSSTSTISSTTKMAVHGITTRQAVLAPRPTKSPIYDIDYRNFSPMEGLWSEKLNDMLQKAYKTSSHLSYTDQFLEKVLKQFLNATTQSPQKAINLAELNKNSYNYKLMIDNNVDINTNGNNNKQHFSLFTRPSAVPQVFIPASQPLPLPQPQRFSPLAQTVSSPATTTSTYSSSSSSSTEIVSYSHISCAQLEDGEFVRDPHDCGVFYTCFMGKPSKRSKCDDGLAFDQSIKVCNWKSQVNC